MEELRDAKNRREIADSRRRSHRRVRQTEAILYDVERRSNGLKFPVSGEEVAAEYADQLTDFPNETEALASALDRLDPDDVHESPVEVREAIYDELTGESIGDKYHVETEFHQLRTNDAEPSEYGEEAYANDLDDDYLDDDYPNEEYRNDDWPDRSPEEFEESIPSDGRFDEYVDGSIDLPDDIERRLRARDIDEEDEDSLGEIDD